MGLLDNTPLKEFSSMIKAIYDRLTSAENRISNLESADAGGGGGAPVDAFYILQQADGDLPNAQDISALSDGILKHVSGVFATAIGGTDYANASHTHVLADITDLASLDHGGLAGLGDDDHTQYLLLAGRGGQSISDYVGVNVAASTLYQWRIVSGLATRQALTVQGHPSQFANTMQVNNGSGSPRVAIDSDGKLLIYDSTTIPPLNVIERSAAPSSPAANDIYLDDGTNTTSGNPGWRRYTGAGWEDINAGGVTDHGALTGLGDDDHTQYLLLAGRTGQSINDYLSVGSTANTLYQLYVLSQSATRRVLRIRGHASQTSDLMDVLNGSGTVRLRISAEGKLVIADDSAVPPFNITERSTAPSSPATNDIYMDDGTNTASGNPGWRRYTGAGWEDVNTGTPIDLYENGVSTVSAIDRIDLKDDAFNVEDGGSNDGHVYLDAFPAPGGRLTLSSGNPVHFGTDVTAATTLYYTPYIHDIIKLYDGTRRRVISFAETSISLAGLTANLPYAVYGYYNSGSLALELEAYASVSARTTAIAWNAAAGAYVKSGTPTRIHLGDIWITATTGQCEMSVTFGGVWNRYNQEFWRFFYSIESSHSYSSSTYRPYNNDSSHKFDLMLGEAQDAGFSAQVQGSDITIGSEAAYCAIGINSTTTASTPIAVTSLNGRNVAWGSNTIPARANSIYVLEAAVGTVTMGEYWIEALVKM